MDVPSLRPSSRSTRHRRWPAINTTERLGGAAALLIAAGYIAIMPLFALVTAPPAGVRARLEFHATDGDAWWAIVGLSVATDLLFVPLAASLYTTLRHHGPAGAIAPAFVLLFVTLDLAVLWPAKVALISLGGQYASASAAQRELLLAAAAYPAAVADSILTSIYSVLTLGIGILATGLAMLSGQIARATAVVGVIVGAVSLLSVAETALTGSFPILVVPASVGTIVWLAMIGAGLLRSPRASSAAGTPAPGR